MLWEIREDNKHPDWEEPIERIAFRWKFGSKQVLSGEGFTLGTLVG